VVIATDSTAVAEAALQGGAEVVRTPPAASGSDRSAWVLSQFQKQGETFDAVLNIQGDEPFLGPEAMGAAVGALDCGAAMTTLATFLKPEDKGKAQVVKVLMSPDGRALDFSRVVREGARGGVWLKHIGIYGFRGEYLERFVALDVPPRERAERLEQLRALEDGAWIQVVVGGDWDPLGVDTAEDLAAARRRWETRDHPHTLERSERYRD
jgi:3-deoxy-manno-octulosonate cytidylyltransferase (CMP-KDO synthetase)